MFRLSPQVTEPDVTKRKFDQEIEKFKAVEERYRLKGILCQHIQFPNIHLLFCTTKLQPNIIGFSVLINFNNYDTEPPSVQFVDPFSLRPLKREEIPFAFLQFSNPFQPQDLVQGVGDILPFLCIPGVKEYHNHPAHSGDSWFLYRGKGEGTLLFIMDQLYQHSISTVKGFLFQQALPKIQVNQEFKVPQVNIQIR